MPPDPRQAQLYRTPATNAAYGTETFNEIPAKAEYPPQGIPTLFITKADIEKHYGDGLKDYNPNDPFARAKMQMALVEVLKETGVPNSALGGTPEQFAQKAVAQGFAEDLARDSPVAVHPSRMGFGNQLGIVVLSSKPQSFADFFGKVAGIDAAHAPNLGALGGLTDRYFEILHEARHISQVPGSSVAQMERDADRVATAAHPGLASALMDARMMGAMHQAIQGVPVVHSKPVADMIEQRYGADSPTGMASDRLAAQGLAILGEAMVDAYQAQKYPNGPPTYPLDAGALKTHIEARLESGKLSATEQQQLAQAARDLGDGKPAAAVMQSLQQTGPDGKVTTVAGLDKSYQRTMLGVELTSGGPQVVAPLMQSVLSAQPSPFASRPPAAQAFLQNIGNLYLNSVGNHYPELRNQAAPKLADVGPNASADQPKMRSLSVADIAPAAPEHPPEGVARTPTIIMPRMPMLAPLEDTPAPVAAAPAMLASVSVENGPKDPEQDQQIRARPSALRVGGVS